MAGFDYAAGRSNNMVAAESRGMVTIGRWARRHGVSARAATEVMQPTEAHHTGTGRRGRSRLTPVIDSATEPTEEQLAAMQAWDRGDRPIVQGWYTAWERRKINCFGKLRSVPVLAVFRGDAAAAPKSLIALDDDDYQAASTLAGRDLAPYARYYTDLRD